MEKTPTAEEWLLNHKEMSKYDIEDYDEGGYLGVNEGALYKIMIEFAKLHVEAALKSASEATLLYNFKEENINSYPLDKIK